MNRQANSDGQVAQQGMRLSREVIDELLFPSEDNWHTAGDERQIQPICDLVPDVVGIEFRYHDGENWRRSWSSGRVSQLPVAIEVTIDVVTAQQLVDLETLSPKTEQPDRLERYLRQVFTRPEPEQRRQRSAGREPYHPFRWLRYLADRALLGQLL